jgi:hypothetical protein
MTDVIITESQFKLPDGLQVYHKTWAVRLFPLCHCPCLALN